MMYKPERALTPVAHETKAHQAPFVEMMYKPERALTPHGKDNIILICVVEMMYKPERALTLSSVDLQSSTFNFRDIWCLSPAKKYKLYKSSINKSLHFAQRSLSRSTRGQRVTAQLNLSRE